MHDSKTLELSFCRFHCAPLTLATGSATQDTLVARTYSATGETLQLMVV